MAVLRSTLLALGCLLLPAVAAAVECTPLRPVGITGDDGAQVSEDYVVSKSISPAPLALAKSNWNTDFEIPNVRRFSTYRVEITPDSDGQYDLVANLKYANDRSQNIYEKKGISLGKGRTLAFSGAPGSETTLPYQVNVYFGGTLSTGKSYRLQVSGCR